MVSQNPSVIPWVFFLSVLTNFTNGQDNYKTLASVYDNIFKDYNNYLRPGHGNEAVQVGITINVLRISDVDDVNQEFHWDMYFRQFWSDDRLSFATKGAPSTLKSLESAALKRKVWTPDPFFVNQREGHVLDNPSDNTLFRISSNGEVLYSSRQLVRTLCPMDLKKYPFDVQECSLEVESFAHTTNEIKYYWRNGDDSVTLNDGLTIPNFKLENISLKTNRIKTATGEYVRLILTFVIKRNAGKFITRSAMPAAVVIIISWLSFWLDPVDHAGARFIILALSKLFLLLLTHQAIFHLNVSYVTQAHMFFFDCFMFLLVNMLVSVLLCVIGRNAKRLEEDGRCHNHCLDKFSWLDIIFRAAYLPVFFIFYAAFLAG